MRRKASFPSWKSALPIGQEPEPMNMRELVKELEARREEIRKMGGTERVARQHARGKKTARDRMSAFFDDGVYFEVGMHGTQPGLPASAASGDKTPADAVI